MLKVQVGLKPEMQTRLVKGGAAAVHRFADQARLTQVDSGNLAIFGMLTAQVEADALDALARNDGVAFVEPVKARQAI